MRGRAIFPLAALVACHATDRASPDSTDHPPMAVTVTTDLAPDAVVAFRAGDGPWTIEAGSATPHNFDATDRYQLVVGCSVRPKVFGGSQVEAYDLTVDEITAIGYDGECSNQDHVLDGTISASPVGATEAQVSWGQQVEASVALTMAANPLSIPIGAGVRDLVVGFVAVGPDARIAQVQIVRDASADTAVNIDLSEEIATTYQAPTATGGIIESASSELITRGGATVTLNLGRPGVGQFVLVPSDGLQAGDVLVATVAGTSGGVQQTVRHIAREPSTSFVFPEVPSSRPTFADGKATLVAQHGAVAYRLSVPDDNYRVLVSPGAFEKSDSVEFPVPSGPAWSFMPPPQPSSVSVDIADTSLADEMRHLPSGESAVSTLVYFAR